MRGVAGYIFAGLLGVVATSMLAPGGRVALSVGARPAVEGGAIVQTVNRRDKGDRLDLMKIKLGRERELEQKQPEPATMPEGCEPVVSALSAVARAENIAHRCLAEITGLRRIS